jgi:hypothetical protein
MSKKGTLTSLKKAINPTEGSLAVRQSAKKEFYKFAQDSFDGLYASESRIINAKPSIVLFSRFDIGLIASENGEVHYFVNEVERTATASLWTNNSRSFSESPIGTLGSTFAEVLYKWIQNIKNPVI